jgi:glycosyltransferase involved in cell wall biosynthesis
MSSTTSNRFATVVGDPNDINTWSNIPYFFMRAGQRRGFFDGGLPLKPERLRLQRWAWNLGMLLRTGSYGGFQYSEFFLNRLFDQVAVDPDHDEFISHFPLLPPKPAQHGYRVSYYIDATLKQNFDDYGVAANVTPVMQERAVEQERRNYHHADRVVTMSRWAADSVVEDYGVPDEHVHIVPGGANLREKDLPDSVGTTAAENLQPLRLGFIGKNWQRKGLPFLLRVAESLEEQGIDVEVSAIGPEASDLPNHRLLQTEGFIDKDSDLPHFVEAVRSFHFGCLFSSIEAFGISNVECLRLGIPVLAFDVGGIPDTVPDDCGLLFASETHSDTVAERLVSFVDNPSRYDDLQRCIKKRSEEFTWDRVIRKFEEIWKTDREHSQDTTRRE